MVSMLSKMKRGGAGFLLAVVVTVSPTSARAQAFNEVGSRALGMGGAFVAVADDATAIYWNPAGFATGALFSLVADVNMGETRPGAARPPASDRSTVFVGFGVPSLGLGYYRLRTTRVQSSIEGEPFTSSLTTHHTAVTLLNTIVEGLVVGASLKVVHGSAAQQIDTSGLAAHDLLDRAEDLVSREDTDFDADIGVMLNLNRARVGMLVRNAREAEFETPGGGRFRLERQARAGVAFLPSDAFTVSLDVDLSKTTIETGEQRLIAIGAEHWFAGRRFGLRGGGHGSTVGDARPAGAFGGSWALGRNAFIDGHITRGSDDAERGWGISARFVY
jgi:hypothetical protein